MLCSYVGTEEYFSSAKAGQIESNFIGFTCFDKVNTGIGLLEFIFTAWFWEWLYVSFYQRAGKSEAFIINVGYEGNETNVKLFLHL